ncbi:uncharacterized protein EI90DRAFT_1937177 [Cantharellus anzutake]|uniref:uncharacterized protein n=1 Tax=Cantharellus anzutake TaxID=1750568 RepID=UPI00190851B0|nr:uncharacterized protein EI90DRAFT_1937177 [Cantharellus anzutake]KAF8326327.1 hypothetical protein EI90DRAFT_1937177 [Cantharellus anzutake]
MISSSFFKRLPQIFLRWERDIRQTTVPDVHGIIILTTSITNLLKSSLNGSPPVHRASSITYNPIRKDPSSFFIPLLALIRNVVLSVLSEINSRSESILELSALIEDSRVTGAVKSVLNAIKNCYTWVDDIFCATDAPQVLSSTRGLLSMLHWALHEHLHAYYGIQGARIISSSFSEELPRVVLTWRRSVQKPPRNTAFRVDGIITATTSITNLVKSSLKGGPSTNRNSITYDRISDDPNLFSIPLPTLIRKVVISVLNDIDSRSESILKLTALTEDSRMAAPVKSILAAMKACYASVDDIFCAPHAPQILSTTRGLLSTLHQALHEHLHARYGIRGARMISSSFLNELPQIFLSWKRNIQTSSQNKASTLDGIVPLATSITNLVKSSLKGSPSMNRSSITYDRISIGPNLFYIPLPTLIRKVVISVLNEIDSRSESISKLTTLIEDPIITGPIKFILNVIKTCYALHEHLHACYGIQGARIISSNFSKEFPRMFPLWEQSIRMSSQNGVPHVDIIILTTGVTNLLASSLKPHSPDNQNPSITYDPIGNDPSSFSIPLPTLIRKVVISVLNEIDSKSESILKLTTLIEDSRITEPVKSVLNSIKTCYTLVDDIFCARDAPQILSSTRGFLSTLHQALHEHLHACYGVQGARIISSSFLNGLPQIFLSWEQNILMFSQNPSSASAMDGIITLITSITNLVKSSLNGNPPVHRDSSIIYDPIDNDPSSFSIPLPTLIRKVVLSMLNEIDSRSELILKLAALIQDSRVMRAIKSVLNVIKNRYVRERFLRRMCFITDSH